MTATTRGPFTAWGTCSDCGFQGALNYFTVAGECYDDPEALGVMMLLHCPACGSSEHALVASEYFQELLAGAVLSDQEEP